MRSQEESSILYVYSNQAGKANNLHLQESKSKCARFLCYMFFFFAGRSQNLEHQQWVLRVYASLLCRLLLSRALTSVSIRPVPTSRRVLHCLGGVTECGIFSFKCIASNIIQCDICNLLLNTNRSNLICHVKIVKTSNSA